MSDTAPSENSDHAAPASAPVLSTIEARILGSLIEKAAITPDIYPLTLNAIVQACNQKSSREPVMHLEPGEIGHALRGMETRGLVKLDPSSQRAARWTHCFDAIYAVTPRQRALLCTMLLRGPQTVSELHARCERLADFPGLDDVRDSLERLIARAPGLVVRIPRSGGQREDRYMHLLCGPVDIDAYASSAPPSHTVPGFTYDDLVERLAITWERVTRLEEEVFALKQQLANLIGSQTRDP